MVSPANAFATRFPSMPGLSAEWMPIYLEPLSGSGERLTAAVASRTENGAFYVMRTFDSKKARCMYGEHAASVLGFVDLIVQSLNDHLEAGGTLHTWQSPLRDGAVAGRISTGYGADVQSVARAGLMLASSLAVWRAPELEQEQIERTDDEAEEWTRQIREETVSLREAFAPRFLRKVPLRPGAPPTKIGYFGDRLAAQFGRLIPGRGLTNHRNRAKAYITDLQILRDQEYGLITRPYYELMLWLPPSDSPVYTQAQHEETKGAFAEMEAFGDKHDLRVEAMADSRAAVQRILRAEEAI